MTKLIMKNDTTPSTPSSGKTSLYVDSTTKKLVSKDDAGVETSYGDSGASDHTALTSIGTNTHAQIDTHISINTGTNTGDQTNITGNAGTSTVTSGIQHGSGSVEGSEADAPTAGQVLTALGSTSFDWQTPSGGGSGDVVGPASAVDSNVAMFDTTTGKLLKDSGLTLSGSNTGDQTTITGNSGSSDALKSATTTVNVSSATAPTTGQVLTATASTTATWQTPTGGSTVYSNPDGTHINTEIFGASATVTGTGATAIGYNVLAEFNSVSVGSNITSTGQYNVQIGAVSAGGDRSTCVGYDSGNTATWQTSIGAFAGTSAGNSSVSIGYNAQATGLYSTAIGLNTSSGLHALSLGGATTAGSYSICLGYNSTAGIDAVAIGWTMIAGNDSVAIGYLTDSGVGSVVIGHTAQATGVDSIAIGRTADDGGFSDCIVLGIGTTATANNEINIGGVITGDVSVNNVETLGVFSPGQFATGSLPTASSWEGYIAYDTTTQTMKWSNGTAWATI